MVSISPSSRMELLFCVLSAITLLQVVSASTISRSGCPFKLPSDVPENEPVYLSRVSNRLDLFDPSEQINYIPQGQSLQLFCPGSQNSVQIIHANGTTPGSGQVTGQNSTTLTCNRANQFVVNNSPIPINRLNCTKPVMGDMRTTTRRCGARSEAVVNQIGFRVNADTFITLINSCFNSRTASTNFVRYQINGKAIRYNVKENDRRSFSSSGLPAGIKANDAFKKANQILHFDQLLGVQQNYINSSSYLARGHLAADADFIFSSGQFATYFYVNVAPQFQAINAGNWYRVERIARNLAMNYGIPLTVYTGTMGQLKLASKGLTTTASQKALYLHANRKMIVPQYFYKIIVDELSASAIVFVTSNNPFLSRVAARPFCTNVCERAGLDMKQFSEIRKGFTFCCGYEEFLERVDISPFSHSIQKLLSCSNLVLMD